jgi:hypothetical protein
VKRSRVKKAKKADKGEGSDSNDVGKRKNRAFSFFIVMMKVLLLIMIG